MFDAGSFDDEQMDNLICGLMRCPGAYDWYWDGYAPVGHLVHDLQNMIVNGSRDVRWDAFDVYQWAMPIWLHELYDVALEYVCIVDEGYEPDTDDFNDHLHNYLDNDRRRYGLPDGYAELDAAVAELRIQMADAGNNDNNK